MISVLTAETVCPNNDLGSYCCNNEFRNNDLASPLLRVPTMTMAHTIAMCSNDDSRLPSS
jgi:hypothetical protein